MERTKQFFIYDTDAPDWDRKKSFFEQEPSTLAYFAEEWKKITKGIKVGGVFIHPWLYFHLNYFKTPIPQKNKTESTINPPLRDNEWYMAEMYSRAEQANKGLVLYGSRRFSKALKNSEPLYYTDGVQRPIGDAKVGDEIIGGDGKPTKIIGVYPQGKVDLYKITLSDGRDIVCCDEHLWQIQDVNTKEILVEQLKDFRLNFNNFAIPINPERKETTIKYVPIESIEKVEKNLATCITVDNEDKLFLTRNCIVTHNSVLESSILLWNSVIHGNSTSEIICGDVGDLNTVARFLRIGYTNLHPAFKAPTVKQDWGKLVQFGFKDKKSKDPIVFSEIIVKNANAGKTSASEKGAGGAPVSVILDEIGKYAFLPIFSSLLPALETPTGLKCVPILTGTSGTEELSRDALTVLSDPEKFHLMPMDWDLLESFVDPEYITWQRSTFGMFAPAQMAYKVGIEKQSSNLAKFLKDPENKKLQEIPIKVTNWKKAKEVYEGVFEKLKKDKQLLDKERMYRPLDPMDCFLSGDKSPFPKTEAKITLKRIIEEGTIGKDVELYRENGIIKYTLSDLERAPSRFQGGIHKAPMVLFGDLPLEKPEYGHFVSGLDPYKQAVSTTSSLGSFYVLERVVNLNIPIEKIRLSYTARPTRPESFYKNALLGIEAFNAECFGENADLGFIQYMEAIDKADLYLAEGVDWSRQRNPNSNPTKRFGYHPTAKNNEYLFRLVVSYCWQEVVIGEDEETKEPIVKLGIEYIEDPELLEEIIDWREGGNYDRIVAFGAALAWARYLDSLHVMPKRSASSYTNAELYNQKKKKEKAKLRAKSRIRKKRI